MINDKLKQQHEEHTRKLHKVEIEPGIYNSRHKSLTLLADKKRQEIILKSVNWYGNYILCEKEKKTNENS